MTATVVELPNMFRDDRLRAINRRRLEWFVSVDPVHRSARLAETGVVFYDEHGVFHYAIPGELPSDAVLQAFFNQTPVRYWTRGV